MLSIEQVVAIFVTLFLSHYFAHYRPVVEEERNHEGDVEPVSVLRRQVRVLYIDLLNVHKA